MSKYYDNLEKELVGEKKEVLFAEEDGTKSSMIIQSVSGPVSMGERNWKIANNVSKKGMFNIQKRKKGILRSDIGVKSGGFTKIATLALIIAFAGVIIAYLAFRY